jgi:hypothetical protein
MGAILGEVRTSENLKVQILDALRVRVFQIAVNIIITD